MIIQTPCLQLKLNFPRKSKKIITKSLPAHNMNYEGKTKRKTLRKPSREYISDGMDPANKFIKGDFIYELHFFYLRIWRRQLLLDYHHPSRSLLLLRRQQLQQRQHLRLSLLSRVSLHPINGLRLSFLL